MRYPNPLKKGSTIAVTAPSCGVSGSMHARLDQCVQNLRRIGFKVVEGKCLREADHPASDSKENRAAEFMDLYCREDIDAIFLPWGGEIAIDILPLLDWDLLSVSPQKWVIGYSDTSTLLLPLTILLDSATLHATNLMDIVEGQSHPLVEATFEAISTLPGDMLKQKQSTHFQKEWEDYRNSPSATYKFAASTRWKSLHTEGDFRFHGRLIGGCLDTISMLTGTKFGRVPDFIMRYRVEGIIFYFENCDLEPFSLHRTLMNLKLAGWLDDVNGILIGRSRMSETDDRGYSYLEAIKATLGDLNIPVLLDVDIGHLPPNMGIVNGSKAVVVWEGGEGEIIQEYI